jgi:hypothetical protein
MALLGRKIPQVLARRPGVSFIFLTVWLCLDVLTQGPSVTQVQA